MLVDSSIINSIMKVTEMVRISRTPTIKTSSRTISKDKEEGRNLNSLEITKAVRKKKMELFKI